MKSVVITGSTRGIGLAMADEFLKAGCNVTLSGRGGEATGRVAELLKSFNGRCIYVPCDVQSKPDLQKLWDKSAAKWGSIDIWINNAGQNQPYEHCYDVGESYVAGILDTNIAGMIYGCQIAAKGMIVQKSGAIYSMEGLGSNNMIQRKTVLYGTTKCALTYFMRGLARELEGTGVIAGRLSPGMMLTDFILKTPDGAAAAIETEESFKKIFNILADRPEPVAEFFVKKMLANSKNGVRINWMNNAKAMGRFMAAPFNKRKLV